jgi:hypothetical protein
MYGSCCCRNIEIRWQVIDLSLVPRACQCEYCRASKAAWVSKSGSRFKATIRKRELHRETTQGCGLARFHECSSCGDVVFVTAAIDGELYGALNASCMHNPQGFGPAISTEFGKQDSEQKVARWRSNWCHPVRIIAP